MDGAATTTDDELAALAGLLREAGGRFAFLHGSRFTGGSRPHSDLDVAVWFGGPSDDLALLGRLDRFVQALTDRYLSMARRTPEVAG
jgi:predicted nucleotidyltransferase